MPLTTPRCIAFYSFLAAKWHERKRSDVSNKSATTADDRSFRVSLRRRSLAITWKYRKSQNFPKDRSSKEQQNQWPGQLKDGEWNNIGTVLYRLSIDLINTRMQARLDSRSNECHRCAFRLTTPGAGLGRGDENIERAPRAFIETSKRDTRKSQVHGGRPFY